jgi:hypothetical protein
MWEALDPLVALIGGSHILTQMCGFSSPQILAVLTDLGF